MPVRLMIRAALVGALLVSTVVVVMVGVFAYHSAAASRAQDAPADEAVSAAFKEEESRWRRIDWPPAHRLVLISAEEYGTGKYLFVFDVYTWFGIGAGYATHCPAPQATEIRTCPTMGGIVRDGGFAGIGKRAVDSDLLETRAAWTRMYGGGRVVAPTVR